MQHCQIVHKEVCILEFPEFLQNSFEIVVISTTDQVLQLKSILQSPPVRFELTNLIALSYFKQIFLWILILQVLDHTDRDTEA